MVAPFERLMEETARLFDAEERGEGPVCADAFRQVPTPQHRQPPRSVIQSALETSYHPAAIALYQAGDWVPWELNSTSIFGATDDAEDVYFVARIIGPGCLMDSDTILAGYFLQLPGIYYPLHHHEAAETYVVIGGEADWTSDMDIFRFGPGTMIHHPPYMPHAMRTFDQPLIAAWRWSGNIDTDTYRFLEGW